MISYPSTLAELPAAAARRFGDKVALYAGGTAFTFNEIERRVAAIAGGLERLALRRGDRVVLHLPNGWQWVVAYYAIARIGAVIVPANILLVSREIEFIARDCAAAAIIAPPAVIGKLKAGELANSSLLSVAVGDSLPHGSCSWEELLLSPPLLASGQVGATDISTIGYTSGTTGRTKGAVLTHGGVVTNTAMTATMHVRTAADTIVTALPCSHVYGNVVLNGAFLCGYSLVLLERFDADAALDAIERHQATMFEGVPTMYNYLLGSNTLSRRQLKSLTRASVGGQTMPLSQLKDAQQRLGCPLLELWGMTEIAGLGTTHALYGPERLGSIGRPLPMSECRIADLREPTQSVPVGEAGELLFRGPTVMSGYYDNPKATDEAMMPGGWLRTGDVAYRDSDGYLFGVDRIKEMIITAGYNIYPSEVERVIAAHPAVHMVAVGGQPDNVKGELAHAYVVLRPLQSLDEETLIAYCRSHLAAYKVPKAIHFVPDLPKTSTGKIIRRALRTLSA